jgi:hypothetical protein
MNRIYLGTLITGILASTLLACSGTDGVSGKDGRDGKDAVTPTPGSSGAPGVIATASLSGIVPARGLLGRRVTLTISGVGTAFDKANKPKVDFGDPAITVDPMNVSVASPTALIVVANIGGAATVGKKSVKIGTETYEGFAVESPLALKLQGTVAQGGIVSVTARNRDVENPFDTTSTGGFLTPVVYTNVKATVLSGGKAAAGVNVNLSSVKENAVDLLALFDVKATPATLDLSIESGPGKGAVASLAPGELKLAARAPVALTAAVMKDVKEPGATDLYTFQTGAGDTLNSLTVASVGTVPVDATPRAFILPASGKFTDLIAGTRVIGVGAETYYGIFWDSSGLTGYNYKIEAKSQAATSVADAATNVSSATAAVAPSLPFILKAGELSSATDADWIQVNVAAGKKLAIGTLGDPQTDTAIEVFQADGTTAVGGKIDASFQEATTTAVLTAGKYFVKISVGTDYAPAAKSYQAYVTEE